MKGLLGGGLEGVNSYLYKRAPVSILPGASDTLSKGHLITTLFFLGHQRVPYKR